MVENMILPEDIAPGLRLSVAGARLERGLDAHQAPQKREQKGYAGADEDDADL